MKIGIGNERGQAMTAALIILPIALTLFCAAIVLIWAFALEARATAACRVSLAESQGKAALTLARLLALNDTAEKFEKRRRVAQLVLKAAIVSLNPGAISAARTSLAIIEAMQVPVALKQKSLVLKGRQVSMQATFLANEAIRSALPEKISADQSGTAVAKIFSKFSSQSKAARFEVVAFPADARTPTYRTAAGFNKSQEAKVRWLLQLPSARAQTDSPASPDVSASIEIGCAMTLEKTRGEKWEPQMTEDKLLRN